MTEMRLEDLPRIHTNLGLDDEPIPRVTAPTIPIDVKLGGDFRETTEQRPAPFQEPDAAPRTLVYSPKPLDFEDVFEACVKYTDNNCCYGKRFANQMKVTDITNRGVFHYRLESFVEKRQSTTSTAPYRGGSVDGPENGCPPHPWDITALPSAQFRDSGTRLQISHTESVHACSKCGGNGKTWCRSCNGSGFESVWSCLSNGRDTEDDICPSCPGPGSTVCWSCFGSGIMTCIECDGCTTVKECNMLIVTWKNHQSKYVTDTDQLPPELILEATGVEMFKETDAELQPLTNAPESVINDASARLLQSHKTSFPNGVIRKQRHVLRATPFTRVTYKWKGREGEFYIYGTDRRVYFEDDPQKSCCCTCC